MKFLILFAVFAVMGMAAVIAVSRRHTARSVIRGWAAGIVVPVSLLLPFGGVRCCAGRRFG